MKFSVLARCLLSLLFVSGVTSVSWASLEFHPRLTFEEEFNDNIYLDDENEEEDWITTVAPGFGLIYDSRSLEATIDYSLRYRFYKNNDQENIDSFKDVQRAEAEALFFPERPFTLRLAETISSEELDERRNSADYNELVNRSTVYDTTINPRYRLQLMSSFALVTGYSYNQRDYVEPEGDDYKEHEGRLSLVKTLSSRTEIATDYVYTDHQSDDDVEDFERQDYLLRLVQEVGGRTTATVETGYGNVDYDSGGSTDIMLWRADVSYRLTPIVTLSAGYSQDFDVSATEGLIKRRLATLGAHYLRERVTSDLELYWYKDDYLRDDTEDEGQGVRFSLSRTLSRPLTAGFDLAYERARYNDIIDDEDVDLWSFGTALHYEYRRFLASLGYRLRISDSELDANDYTNNVVMLSGTVRF